MSYNFDEIAVLAEARGGIYRFLSSLYLEPPSEEMLKKIREELEELGSLFPSSIEHFKVFFNEHNGDVKRVRQDFMDLFMVPTKKYVTPYEAVYMDKRIVNDQVVLGLLVGSSTGSVKRTYEKMEMELSSECKELPDYIGLELEFMSHLCRKEKKAEEEGNRDRVGFLLSVEREFIRDHLGKWVPMLCERVFEKAETGFFKGLAQLTKEFIERDYNTVSDLCNIHNPRT